MQEIGKHDSSLLDSESKNWRPRRVTAIRVCGGGRQKEGNRETGYFEENAGILGNEEDQRG